MSTLTFRTTILSIYALSIFFHPIFGVPNTLTTTMAGGNGAGGNMFDICAINSVSITQFDINCNNANAIEIYAATDPNQGYLTIEYDANSWTLIHTQSLSCNSAGMFTILNPLTTTASIDAGECRGFYVTATGGGGLHYTNGGTVGNVYVADSNIQIKEGLGRGGLFGNIYSPRVWNGRVTYTTVTPSLCADCVSDCTNVLDGDYKSCSGPNVYASCTNEILIDNRPCPGGLQWDDMSKRCGQDSGCTAQITPAKCSGCVGSCINVVDGDYESCEVGNVYVTCSNGIKHDNRACNDNLVWNDQQKMCDYPTSTNMCP